MAQINKPSDYFNTITYTGNDTDGRTITGVGFQSDFTWVKARSSAFSHYIIDAIRYDSGASKYLKLDSSSTAADETPSGAGWISALNSDGYVCKNGTSNTNNCNENGVTYVAWNWLGANGTASNTDGTITSTVSANTTSGFSVVSYTGNGTGGATVGHGIDTPKMIIVKNRDDTDSWEIYHASLGETKYLQFTSAAAGTNTNRWNDTAPTSSVFSLGTEAGVNQSGEDFIAYCFAEKKGFSKFGSYTGNGSADGTFVYTGFKPAWVLVKNTSTGDHWNLSDNKRNPSNQVNRNLYPSLSNVEGTTAGLLDYLSNGFKLRDTDGSHNGSGTSYIYMAFAENPLVGTNNIPATAR
jgi:hypothetical protein